MDIVHVRHTQRTVKRVDTTNLVDVHFEDGGGPSCFLTGSGAGGPSLALASQPYGGREGRKGRGRKSE